MAEVIPHDGVETPLLISLDAFDGPLDLLLQLIRKHELDILDIPIAFITREYLRYIDALDARGLASAGEYLVIAAQLLWMKSRTLLPRPAEDSDDDSAADEGDPREALVRRLLAYQRYRAAAEALDARSVQGRDVFVRPSRAQRFRAAAGPAALVPLTLYELLDAFRILLERIDRPEYLHEITRERLSLRDTVNRIAGYLDHTPRTTLLDLIYLDQPHPRRRDIVITFLALLEMARLKLVRLFQSRLSTRELHVERAVLREGELEQRLTGLLDEDPPEGSDDAAARTSEDAAALPPATRVRPAEGADPIESDETPCNPPADGYLPVPPDDVARLQPALEHGLEHAVDGDD